MADKINDRILHESICNLIRAFKTEQGYEVELPQVYHTGHAVTVVVSPVAGGFLVHDNSYAAMLLSSHGLKVTQKLSDSLAPQVGAYGCEFEEFRVKRVCVNSDHLGFVMSSVGCASRLVADLLLKSEPAPMRDFRASVISQILETVGPARVRTNEEVSGHLGSRYRVSAVVLDLFQSHPIAFIEPVSDREAIARRFKQFYDLARTSEFSSVQRVAVYDDAQPISSGDALLMGEVGNFVRYRDAPVRFREWSTVQ